VNEKIEEFFERHHKSFNEAIMESSEIDAKEIAQCFSDCFIAANPDGVACGKIDEELESQICKALHYYRSIGTRSMKISEITVTALDQFHALARVRWQSEYRKRDGEGERIDFDVIYQASINRPGAEDLCLYYRRRRESPARERLDIN
jgi:hypothetical protein